MARRVAADRAVEALQSGIAIICLTADSAAVSFLSNQITGRITDDGAIADNQGRIIVQNPAAKLVRPESKAICDGQACNSDIDARPDVKYSICRAGVIAVNGEVGRSWAENIDAFDYEKFSTGQRDGSIRARGEYNSVRARSGVRVKNSLAQTADARVGRGGDGEGAGLSQAGPEPHGAEGQGAEPAPQRAG